MLEIAKPNTLWLWYASGKHPVARDYLELGHKHVMTEAFYQWIDEGHQTFGRTGKKAHPTCSWRFWAMTPKSGDIALGLIKDSCDAIGRPFPFLIMMVGKLEGWEKHWELLPIVCEKSWTQMEYVGSRNYKSVDALKTDLEAMRFPNPSEGKGSIWDEYADSPIVVKDSDLPAGMKARISLQLQAYQRESEVFIPLDAVSDTMSLIRLWHLEIKNVSEKPPPSLFIGGAGVNIFMAVFGRPLKKDDFVRLWSVSP